MSTTEEPAAAVRQVAIGGRTPRRPPIDGGPLVELIVGASEGGPVGVLHVTVPPGGAMPAHEHGPSTTLLVALAGQAQLVDDDQVLPLRPEVVTIIPVGRRVRLENPGAEPARLLAVLSPPDFTAQVERWPAAEPEDVGAATATATSETVAEALEREHHEIDAGIEAFLAALDEGRPEPEPLRTAMEALRRHIFLEEEYLFPPLRNAGLFAPIFVMEREHGEIWQTMESLEAGLLAGVDAAMLTRACRDLLGRLERHNAKEEPIIYPHADTDLPAATHSALQAFIVSGQMPEGWVCSGARG